MKREKKKHRRLRQDQHTFTQNPKIHQHCSPCCTTVVCAPWCFCGGVLPGLNGYSQGPIGVQGPIWQVHFEEMQLIWISSHFKGAIWSKARWRPGVGSGVYTETRIICLTNEDVVSIRRLTEIIHRLANIFTEVLNSNVSKRSQLQMKPDLGWDCKSPCASCEFLWVWELVQV